MKKLPSERKAVFWGISLLRIIVIRSAGEFSSRPYGSNRKSLNLSIKRRLLFTKNKKFEKKTFVLYSVQVYLNWDPTQQQQQKNLHFISSVWNVSTIAYPIGHEQVESKFLVPILLLPNIIVIFYETEINIRTVHRVGFVVLLLTRLTGCISCSKIGISYCECNVVKSNNEYC